ncbi:MAG: hypothetical protein ACRYF4_09045 [Janthinobacterium lividum]
MPNLRKLLVGLFVCSSMLAQETPPPSHMLTSSDLNAQGAELLQQARASQFGFAAKVLLDRPDSNIQVTVRLKSGQGEWHRDDADILIGVEGTAQIITGGQIVHGRETAPGEMRGDGVQGGTTQPFGPGDTLRIEPRVAHQMLLAPGTTVRYMAVKVHAAR